MHIGNSTNQVYLDFLSAISTSTKAANTEPKGEEFAGLVTLVGINVSAANIASRYDFANISPREIDQMASELHASGIISDRESLALLAHGADFLSLLPDNYYGEEQLAERSDLLGKIKEKLTLAEYRGEPTADRERLLEMLDNLRTLASAKKNKTGGALQISRISDNSLSEFIALQSTNGGIPVDQLMPIDVSKLEIITLPPKLLKAINQG